LPDRDLIHKMAAESYGDFHPHSCSIVLGNSCCCHSYRGPRTLDFILQSLIT
jgi:hypothetical protein